MPRSSRPKSRKQHKHSSKDAREYSESEEDGNLKDRKCREEVVVRVSRDSASGEKRKVASLSQEGKDLFGPGNGGLSEEYVSSKRRKDRADANVTDRWNGGEDEREESVVGGKEIKGDGLRTGSEKVVKSKVLVDSKSKSSRRSDDLSDRKDEKAGVAVETGEVKKSSNKVESKVKSEKDSGRKEVYQYKDVKEKERGAEKDRKVQDGRIEKSIETVVLSEISRKQGSQSGSFEEDRPVKREVENTELQIHDELRNPELEKELEKRIRRRRDSPCDKDKYQDNIRDANDKRLSSRDDIAKNGKYKDETHKDGRYRDKYREEPDRDRRYRDDKHRDEHSTRDHTNNRSDPKHLKDDNDHHKKSKPHDSDHGGSTHVDDQGSRDKDNRGKKRSCDDNEDHTDVKSRSSKEHRSDMEKKSSSSKAESNTDRGRSQSRHIDDSSVPHYRRKSSPSSSAHGAKDQYSSKQADSRYRETEERFRPNAGTSSRDVIGGSAVQERTFEGRSLDKKDGSRLREPLTERSPRSEHQVSPLLLMEKSPSSTSIDRRYSNRTGARRSLDVEDTGRRSTGSKDARDYSTNEDRGSRELPLEKPTVDEYSQTEGDTVSVTSSFNRTGHMPSTSPSILPPPPTARAGVDSPSVVGSSEEDSRGKSTNRFKRSGEPNMGRGQGNAWKGVTNWSSPVANGYIPFQHGPPPGGFHPVMQQFPASPIFGVRPSMDLNHVGLPYHIPDADRFSGHGRPFGWRNPADESCPPHLRGWDASNGAFGNDPHVYGRPDWDQNRRLMSAGAEMWKGQNGNMNMELSTASQKEGYISHAPGEDIWAGQPGQWSRNERNRHGPRAESIEIKRTSSSPPPKDTMEAPPKIIKEKTPEPCKTSSDDGALFCHVYLAKLDISADLTLPELYDQCMGLLDVEEKKTADTEDATKYVQPDLEVGSEANFPSNRLNASLFPAIEDSVFQRAMALYKESGGMRAKVNALWSPEPEPPKVQISFLEGLEHFPISNKEVVEGPISASNQEEVEGPVPNSEVWEAKDSFPASKQGEVEVPVRTSSEEKFNEMQFSVSAPVGENGEEPVPTPGEGKSEEVFPKSNHDKVQIVASTYQEESKEALEDHFTSLENASQVTRTDDDMNDASSPKDNLHANSAEERPAFGLMCGPVGFSDSSEACEALMPESIECGLVNLSRIHHSPESTH